MDASDPQIDAELSAELSAELDFGPAELVEEPLLRRAARSFAALTDQTVKKSMASLRRLRRKATEPVSGAAIVGATMVGAASYFGLVPVAVGAGAAYIAYQVLQRARDARDNQPAVAVAEAVDGT
jgi:hypothetical protein